MANEFLETNVFKASADNSPSNTFLPSSNYLNNVTVYLFSSAATAASVTVIYGKSSSPIAYILKASYYLSSLAPKYTTTTGFSFLAFSKASASATGATSPNLLVHQATISLDVLPPLYSTASPLTMNLRVGYPLTSYFYPNLECTVASTLTKVTFPSNSAAALTYSGANFLQCPHHGA